MGGSSPCKVAPALGGKPVGEWPETPYNQGQPHTGALGELILEGGSPYGTPNPYGSIMLLINHLETQHFPQDWKLGSLERCIQIQSTREHFPEVRHIWGQWLTRKAQGAGFFTLTVHVPGQLLRLQKDQDCVFSTSYLSSNQYHSPLWTKVKIHYIKFPRAKNQICVDLNEGLTSEQILQKAILKFEMWSNPAELCILKENLERLHLYFLFIYLFAYLEIWIVKFVYFIVSRINFFLCVCDDCIC